MKISHSILFLTLLGAVIVGFLFTSEKKEASEISLKKQLIKESTDSMTQYLYYRNKSTLKNEVENLLKHENLFLDNSPIFTKEDGSDSLAMVYIATMFRFYNDLKDPIGALDFSDCLDKRFKNENVPLAFSLIRHRILADIHIINGEEENAYKEIESNISMIENRLAKENKTNISGGNSIDRAETEQNKIYALILYLVYNQSLIDKELAKRQLTALSNEYKLPQEFLEIYSIMIDESSFDNICLF